MNEMIMNAFITFGTLPLIELQLKDLDPTDTRNMDNAIAAIRDICDEYLKMRKERKNE